MHGASADGIGAPQQGRCAVHVALGQGCAHGRAGHTQAVHLEAHHARDIEAEFTPCTVQKGVVASAPRAEAEVVAHHDQPCTEPLHQDAGDEVLRRQAGQGLVKAQDHQPVHATLGQRGDGVAQRGDAGGRGLGPAAAVGEVVPRVGFEGHDAAGQAALARLVRQHGQHGLVATVHAVEVADGQRAGGARMERRKPAENLHSGIIDLTLTIRRRRPIWTWRRRSAD